MRHGIHAQPPGMNRYGHVTVCVARKHKCEAPFFPKDWSSCVHSPQLRHCMAARSTSASPNRNGFNDKSRMARLSFNFVQEELQFAWAADRSPYHLECHGRKHKRQRPDVTYDGGCSLALGKSKIRTDMMGGCSLNPVKAHIDVVGIRGRLLAQPSRLLAGAKSSNFFLSWKAKKADSCGNATKHGSGNGNA